MFNDTGLSGAPGLRRVLRLRVGLFVSEKNLLSDSDFRQSCPRNVSQVIDSDFFLSRLNKSDYQFCFLVVRVVPLVCLESILKFVVHAICGGVQTVA